MQSALYAIARPSALSVKTVQDRIMQLSPQSISQSL